VLGQVTDQSETTGGWPWQPVAGHARATPRWRCPSTLTPSLRLGDWKPGLIPMQGHRTTQRDGVPVGPQKRDPASVRFRGGRESRSDPMSLTRELAGRHHLSGRPFGDASAQTRVLDKPVSPAVRLFGWVLATALFVASLCLWYTTNGVTDIAEGAVPIAAIHDANPQCAYPAANKSSVPPLYPAVASGLMAITGVGEHQVSQYHWAGSRCTDLGPRIVHASPLPFVLLGTSGWPVLVAGFIMLLGAAGLRRTRWEVLGLCLIACAPAVTAPLDRYLHPEDLFAMAFVLAATASALRSRWLAVGILIGIACCFKQFALLPAVVLLIAAPRHRRLRLVSAGAVTAIVVLGPPAFLMGTGMLDAVRGAYATPSQTSTLVGALNLGVTARVVVSRVFPLIAAAGVALWVRSRVGDRTASPQPLVALVAIALAFRLVFEVNLLGYYFLGVAVALIALDIVVGRIRLEAIGWIIVAAALYPPQFDPVMFVAIAHPLLVQGVLISWAIALAVVPLYRACAGTTSDDVRQPEAIGEVRRSTAIAGADRL